MNDVPDRRDAATTQARDELSRLNRQVAAMRAVLTQLLQDVVRAESRLEHGDATRLLEVNERLVVSALGALTDAETTGGAPHEASRTGGLDPLTGLPQRAAADDDRRRAQLREANEQLVLAALGAQELMAAAEAARRRQSEMLVLVANELSNPFAPIRLAAATLGLPGTEKTLLPRVQAIIEQQVDKLSRLVSELLDQPRVGTGRRLQEQQAFDAARFIEDAVEACRPAMDRRQQTLQAAISAPLEMNGDPASLTQIVMNLLSNASMYTRNGGQIDVAAEFVRGQLLLNVIDSGQTTSRGAAGVILDPFVLDPRGHAGIEAGVGIRLETVREMVEARGGTVVAAHAAGGHGCHFTVSLPAQAVSIDDERPAPV